MTNKKEIYKCEICGNIVEVLHEGAGTLVCCGQPMKLLKENSIDASLEKHVPVLKKVEEGVEISVGSIEHPMTEEHYIDWIEIQTSQGCFRKQHNTGDKPQALFETNEEIIQIRAYCNLHGLWKN
jgi:superoxide reductase